MSGLIDNRLSGLSLQQMQAFCLVYQHQSYAETARQLNLAVPTVWEQIKAVERAWQVELFRRSGRRMQRTEAATQLYEVIEPLVVRLDSTLGQIGDPQDVTPEFISVAAGMRMLIEDFGRPLGKFQQEHPDIQLRLTSADDRRSQDDVFDGRVDVAFMLEPPPDRIRRGLTCAFSYAIDYLAIFPRRHPLSKKRRLKLNDLMRYKLVVGHSDTVGRQLLEQTLYREGLLSRLQIAVETDNSAVSMACVHAGMGVGIVGGHAEGPLMQHMAFVSLREFLGQARIVSVVRRDRLLPKAVERLIELISTTPPDHV